MCTPRIIAHRGASAAWPENTAAAFDAAVAAGAHGIETDLQLTRDGVVAVWHDRDLTRLGAPGVRLADCDWSMLRRLDAGRWRTGRASRHRLLRLEQVLERWGARTTLYLELKQYTGHARQRRLAQRVAARLRRHRLSRRVAALSFHASTLESLRRAAPEVALVRNAEQPREMAAACQASARRAAVCVNVARFRAADVAPAHRAGLPVYVFTCNTPARFAHARRLGAAAVISNRPAAALEITSAAPYE